MNGLIAGARRALRRGAPLEDRLAGLEQAVTHARGRLDDGVVDRAAQVVERAGARLRLTGDHTVVALAGSTGSGKSSTFNALCGLELAAVGVRRPTTSRATACIWGEPADELLDWLDVPPRHRVTRDSALDRGRGEELQGLVLLDLPDHDSTAVEHHVESERLVGLTDLMVWVVDPQKYADAALHERFLTPLASHRDVMLVVLNHVDQVAPDRREGLLADLRRRLAADGLDDVPVLATSALTGEGISELRAAIAARVADKATAGARLRHDVEVAAAALAVESGEAAPRALGEADRADVVEALVDAAGVPVVVEAVHRATTVRSRRATGFPLTSWLSRFKPDPLRRLHLDRARTGRDVVAAARSSLPAAGQVQQARVDAAVRDLGLRASDGLAPGWARAVRRASTSRYPDLADRLDRALVTTDLGVETTPGWCRAVRVVQWGLLVLALVGVLWLGVLAGMSYLQVHPPTPPSTLGVPLPTLLLAAGVLAGVLLAALSRALVALSARRRARRAEKRLRAAVTAVAEELVVTPVAAELDAHRAVHEGLRRAIA